MNKPLYQNMILISGTGRNVGKTTLACRLIKTFCEHGITALKISPHWHTIDTEEYILVNNDKFLILEERNGNGKKDSSKMLTSGARKVYYIQANDENLELAFNYIIEYLVQQEPIICESASLGKFIKPALHLRVTNSTEISAKEEANKIPFDHLVLNNGNRFDSIIDRIQLTGNKWFIQND